MVRKISHGDKQAFRELFQLYYQRLCQFAFLILRSKELCEEAVLDVFFSLWVKREQLNPARNIRSFLYTAVRNHAIDYQRSKTTRTQNNINVYELDIESPEPSVDAEIDLELFRERLQKAFDHLPERCQMIARLHFNDQLSVKEIADIMKISPHTVKAQIVVATNKIKEIFEKYGWNK